MAKRKTAKKKSAQKKAPTKRKKNGFNPDALTPFVPGALWVIILGFLGNMAMNDFPTYETRKPASKEATKKTDQSQPSTHFWFEGSANRDWLDSERQWFSHH